MSIGRAINCVLLTLLLIGVLRITYWGHLNMNGYCWTEHRTLTTQERFRKLIAFENAQPTVSVTAITDGTIAMAHYPRIPYPTTDAFLAKNPACCSVITGFMPGTGTIARFLGEATDGILSIRYTAHFKDEAGHDQSTLVSDVRATTTCGEVK